jgi:hypothetical protein
MIPLVEQITEARRELALRRKCYPAWTKSGKLDAGDAKYQLLSQQEIVGTGSVSCNSAFVLHLGRFLNQEELMEREAMVQNA